MVRDKTHSEQVKRWAEYVRDNPREKWKKELKDFLDSQMIIARRFYKRLEKSSKGREILDRLKRAKMVK